MVVSSKERFSSHRVLFYFVPFFSLYGFIDSRAPALRAANLIYLIIYPTCACACVPAFVQRERKAEPRSRLHEKPRRILDRRAPVTHRGNEEG